MAFAVSGNIIIRKFNMDSLSNIIKIADITLDEKYSIDLFLDIYSEWPEGFLVAEMNNNIVGFLAGARLSARESRILMLAVNPNYQGLGIGSKLVNNFEAISLANGLRTIRLEVRVSNYKAIQFYQKRKYVIANIIPHYYTNNENAFLMWKILIF
ncbi:MAG: GNAT family N-acetyltransferase [Thermoplasmata archaeon]